MKQFPTFLEEPATHPMDMETQHGEGLLSRDARARHLSSS